MTRRVEKRLQKNEWANSSVDCLLWSISEKRKIIIIFSSDSSLPPSLFFSDSSIYPSLLTHILWDFFQAPDSSLKECVTYKKPLLIIQRERERERGQYVSYTLWKRTISYSNTAWYEVKVKTIQDGINRRYCNITISNTRLREGREKRRKGNMVRIIPLPYSDKRSCFPIMVPFH